MEQYSGMKNFNMWLSEACRLYEIAFEKTYLVSEVDSLDHMLFEAMNNRDEAEQKLRMHIGQFVDDTYSTLVRDFINAHEKWRHPEYDRIVNEFHIFLRSFGHSRPFVFHEIHWRNVQMTDAALSQYYKKLCDIFKQEIGMNRYRKSIVTVDALQKELLLWGEHIKTEVRNDGFDGHVIGKKLTDLVGTIAVLTTLLGVS